MSKAVDNAALVTLLDRVSEALAATARPTGLLSTIAWPREVEERFFASGASALPEVHYEVDRERIGARIATLEAVLKKVTGEHEVARWLRETVQSHIDGDRLLLAVGTREFYRLSRELYGGARTRFLGDAQRNLDLAEHVLERLRVRGGDEASDPEVHGLSGEQFAAELRARLAVRTPQLALEITADDDCTAKVIAGMSRSRVRRTATFMPWKLESLWAHEVETHALTAQNGAAQPMAPFLRGGGPRSTRTQEGLAIFAELYSGGMSTERIERLATRVKLVDMAEQGASFLDLYRHLVERGAEPREAYLDAQRICRGGRVEGSAPFTKDACYLSGLVHVYSFLSVVIRGGLRDETELLVAGRIDLDDIAALVELRHRGILTRPKFLPEWVAHWRRLLPYFAFASFFNQVSLAPVEAHYRRVLELAEAYPALPAGATAHVVRDARGTTDGDGAAAGSALAAHEPHHGTPHRNGSGRAHARDADADAGGARSTHASGDGRAEQDPDGK